MQFKDQNRLVFALISFDHPLDLPDGVVERNRLHGAIDRVVGTYDSGSPQAPLDLSFLPVTDAGYYTTSATREPKFPTYTFEGTLLQVYRGGPKSRRRRDFDQWVALAKTHRGAMKAF